MSRPESVVRNRLNMKADSESIDTSSIGGISGSVDRVEKTGQVMQQSFNLEAVTSDTADIINAIAERLGPILHSGTPLTEGSVDEGKKEIVPLAANFERTYVQAVANRSALQSILKRIDI